MSFSGKCECMRCGVEYNKSAFNPNKLCPICEHTLNNEVEQFAETKQKYNRMKENQFEEFIILSKAYFSAMGYSESKSSEITDKMVELFTKYKK